MKKTKQNTGGFVLTAAPSLLKKQLIEAANKNPMKVGCVCVCMFVCARVVCVSPSQNNAVKAQHWLSIL